MGYLVLLPNFQWLLPEILIFKYFSIPLVILSFYALIKKIKLNASFLYFLAFASLVLSIDLLFSIIGFASPESTLTVAIRWFVFLSCFLIGYNRLINPTVWRNIFFLGVIVLIAQVFFVEVHNIVTFIWGSYQDYLTSGVYRRSNAISSHFYSVVPFFLILLLLWGNTRPLTTTFIIFMTSVMSVSRTGFVFVTARLRPSIKIVALFCFGIIAIYYLSRPFQALIEQIFLTDNIYLSILYSKNPSISQRVEDWQTIIQMIGPDFWSMNQRISAEYGMEIGLGKFLFNGFISGIALQMIIFWCLRKDLMLLLAFLLFEIFSISMWRIDVLFLLSIWIGQCYKQK